LERQLIFDEVQSSHSKPVKKSQVSYSPLEEPNEKGFKFKSRHRETGRQNRNSGLPKPQKKKNGAYWL